MAETSQQLRVVSLLPSATDTVASLEVGAGALPACSGEAGAWPGCTRSAGGTGYR